MSDIGFGKRALQARLLLSARRGRTVTQVEVGKHMGVSGVAVGSWESGDKEPDLDSIRRLAKFLEVDPGWLAFGGAAAEPGDLSTPVSSASLAGKKRGKSA